MCWNTFLVTHHASLTTVLASHGERGPNVDPIGTSLRGFLGDKRLNLKTTSKGLGHSKVKTELGFSIGNMYDRTRVISSAIEIGTVGMKPHSGTVTNLIKKSIKKSSVPRHLYSLN